jgi:putative transposase
MADWFTAAELEALALPGLPRTRRGIALAAEAQGWLVPEAEGRSWRRRQGRGGGVEVHLSVLPMAARAKLALEASTAGAAPTPRDAAKATLSHEEAWAWFERLPDHKQAEAKTRLAALDAVAQLVAHGTPKVPAMQMVASERGVKLSTLYAWEGLVRSVPQHHRLPRLAPRHAGATGPRAEASPEALDWLRSRWLSPSRPTAETCIRDLREVAASRGWALPSDRTMRRHLDAIDQPTAIYWREGPEAADRLFPMLRRDRSALHALEMVNADGHRFDVMCLWPDGTKARPTAVTFQDIYSGKVLSWRIAPTENTDAFRLAFGDLVERHGIPDHLFVDNTLAAANKTMSGGLRRRFRFKVRDEEPLGILPTLGVEVHFTRPYSGQSKPIERAFGDFARDVARDPAFEGAYLGNSTSNKPHNAGDRAVPVADFIAVLERRVAEHNARAGRTGGVARGRSFDQVFADSYATAPIRKATAAQRRLWLLAAESVTVRQDSTIHLLGNRYHDAELVHHIGRQVVVRFDPDRLHAPVHIYRADGGFVVTAECWADTGFADTEAARRIGAAKKLRQRGLRDVAKAARVFEAEELARDIAQAAKAEPPAPVETRVVRPIFRTAGNAALKPAEEAVESPLTDAREARQSRVIAALKLHHASSRDRLTADED